MDLTQSVRSPTNSRVIFLFVLLQVVSFFTGAIEEYRPVFVASQMASFFLLFILYRVDALSKKEIVLLAVLLRLLYMTWLPGLSDDAFRYIWDGMLQHSGRNPFSLPPNSAELVSLHNNPIYDALNSKRYFAVYPPLSQVLFYFGGLFENSNSFTHWIGSYYAIKLVRACAELIAMLVLASLLRPKLVLLYALNPLVLVECAGQAHAEASMVLGLIIMIFGIRREKALLAIAGLLLASWTKLYPIIFLPILLKKIGYRYSAVFFLVSAILASFYFNLEIISNIFESVDLYVKSFEFNAGIYYLLKKIVNWWTGVEGWGPTIGPILRMIFILSFGFIVIQNFRGRIGFVASAVWIASFYLMTATTVHPWYLMSLMVFLPFLHPIRWEWYTLAAICLGSYLRYSHSIYWPFVIIAWMVWALVWLLRSHTKSVEILDNV